MGCKEMFGTVDELFSRYLDFWVEVCNEESPSSYKEGVDRVGRLFIREAQRLGFDHEVYHEDVSGDAVCITMNGDVDAAPLVLSGHLDTVHPVGLFGTPPTRIEGGRIYGPGVCDCKGGCVAALLAMEALKINGYRKRPVKLVLQSDEEVGSQTSSKRTVDFMERCSKGAVAFLNSEPVASYKITVERKGIIRFEFKIKGVAVHSACCYDGASAVTEAAHKIIELEKFKNKDGITCNCGVIRGGTTPNTVAEECSFLADVRYKTAAELEEIKAFAAELAKKNFVEGTVTELTVKSFRVSMERKDEVVGLALKLCELARKHGLRERGLNASNGGADSADMVSRGIIAVDSLGVEGAWLHSVNEYAVIDSLGESAKLFVAAAEEL